MGAPGTSATTPPRVLLFVAAVTACGVFVLARAVLAVQHAHFTISFVPLVLLTIVSGRFAIKIPGRPARVSISEVFVFAALLLFGPAAATLTVALDGLCISCMQKDRRVYRTLFNVTEPAIATWFAGYVFFTIAQIPPLAQPHQGKPPLLLATIGMTLVFFVLNSGLTALAVSLENGGSAWSLWRRHGLQLAINYYAAASLAALAAENGSGLDFQVVGLVVPLLILSYVAYKEASSRLEEAKHHVEETERLYEEARQRDDMLRQAQKLEAIGRLAGGVAHDFNNVLTAISGYGELVLDQCDADDPRHADVEEILKAAGRAASLTRQLLAFSRRQVIVPQVLAVERIVAGTEQMLRRLIGEDIRLTRTTGAAVGLVRADPGQIEQVLLNLAVNARDAMPNGGSLEIALAASTVDEAFASRHPPLKAGAYVRLSMTDTGCGMTEEVRAHIFEPFFTTKPEALGTGLGLATVYGIVEQSGGAIEVDTEEGRGTTFHLYLPQVHGVREVSPTRTPRAAPVARASATILLVEDDASVATLVSNWLKKAGFTVLQAMNAGAAIEIARSYPESIDLLLTDVVMPGLNGRELAERVTGMRGDIRVLYMSGYPDDAILLRGVRTTAVQFLQKPFSFEVLADKIHEVLTLPAAGDDRVPAAPGTSE
jgi:signal transduction histidine kinase/CheY-like chemotaxis protein